MKDEVKIDIRGSVWDATCKTAGDIAGILMLMVIAGVLVAPIFAPFFKAHLEEKYDVNRNYGNIEVVRRKMFWVKLWLWVAALAAWVTLFSLA